MRNKLIISAAIIAFSGIGSLSLIPFAQARSVSSIKGADEKMFDESASRCNTPAMQALNDKTVSQMETDIKQRKAEKTQAAEDYTLKIEMTWDAMLQPYCGFGSRGVAAARKSYEKSVARARTAFLNETKKIVEGATAKK
ncbi:MAG: hypothetical protein WCK01_01955 [Candidatus Uhrbacteria bacterium]